ncbi:MAG: N-formylglutamate amidohydrolase, partial [Bacteroidota bacterium]
MNPIFTLIEPTAPSVPILLSIPHLGTDSPKELKDHYDPALAQRPDDTDFDLDKLYDFAPSLGITTIYANYSRWLIDLNRSPDNQSLYQDGRIITALCPITDFKRNPIYKEKGLEPNPEEIERRKGAYYDPYYQKIEEILG